jgi:hypothetical protein
MNKVIMGVLLDPRVISVDPHLKAVIENMIIALNQSLLANPIAKLHPHLPWGTEEQRSMQEVEGPLQIGQWMAFAEINKAQTEGVTSS